MKSRSLALLILISSLTPTQSSAGWFKNFCRDHLIADDPYQFEHLSNLRVADLLIEYKTLSLKREAMKRLGEDLSFEDREILTKALAIGSEK